MTINLQLQRQEYRRVELDRKRWLIRYMLLVGVGIILAFKVYIVLYATQINVLIGIYSFITTFVLFSYLFFAYLKYKDPYDIAQGIDVSFGPLVSVIIPVKNEEGIIEKCVQSCLDSSYQNKEVIVVEDGSTDKTPQILDEMQKKNKNLRIIHLTNNLGKKKAVERGIDISSGEILIPIDSDTVVAIDSIEKAVKIILSDKGIGAITAHIKEGVEGTTHNGNAIQKIKDVWLDNSCRILKGLESSFSSLTCCCGPFTAYRREAIRPFVHAWANDKFLGKEFKFSTDRRLTAYILGAKMGKSSNEVWKLKYSPSIIVYCTEPNTMSKLIRQQIRWRKSFIRSIFATGKIYWRRPFPTAIVYYLQAGLKLIRPFVVLQAFIMMPLAGDYLSPLYYFSGVLFIGMIFGIDYRLRNPGSPNWLYRPLLSLMSIFVFVWLLPYAAVTLRKAVWR
ncbi:MAG: glycosyltransferase [Nitrososphaeraceae archaeon]